jgi:hypothetical protein
MAEIAGEELQYLAFHNGFGPGGEDSPLRGIEYRKDWAKTWEYFMQAYKTPQSKIQEMRERVAGLKIPLAITESHFFLPGRNCCEALSTWAAGVSHARILNVHERNGDLVKIATLADFCGTRWQNNAIIIPTPLGSGHAFMMPVAMVMALFRNHTGGNALKVSSFPFDLDVTASITGSRIFLHVINTNRTQSISTQFHVAGKKMASGRSFCIALEPDYEVFEHKPEITKPKESSIPIDGTWTFPKASVSAVESTIGLVDVYHHFYALELAKDGHLVLAPELPGFSTLSDLAQHKEINCLDYWIGGYSQFALITDGFLYGKSLIGETVEDLLRWEKWLVRTHDVEVLDVAGIS